MASRKGLLGLSEDLHVLKDAVDDPSLYISYWNALAAVFKLACVQLKVCADKAVNVSRAVDFIGEAARAGAQMVMLPVSTCCQ